MARVVVSVTNDLVNDQRVHKVCSSLQQQNWEVLLVGRQLADSAPLSRSYTTHRMRLFFRKGALFYAEYNVRLFFFLLFHKAHVLHSNDLDTLLANYLVAKLRSLPLVYDSHEYFTGVPELQNRKRVRQIWEAIEAWIFPDLQHVFTVNESIAECYAKLYHKSLTPIRNIPMRSAAPLPASRASLGLKESDFLVINQGTGINVDRGMEELVEALLLLPEDVHLVLLGKGDAIPALKKKVDHLALHERVHFLPPRPYAEMMAITACCDLGVSLDKNSNANYRMSLPNKLFDFIKAGIPVLTTQLVEVQKVVDSYQIGRTIATCDATAIAQGITSMRQEGKEAYRKALQKASTELYWEREVIPLLKTYEQFRTDSSPN